MPVSVLTCTFIAFYLYFAWFGSAPKYTLSYQLFHPKLRMIIKRLGLLHEWKMFSPPSNFCNYLEARITGSDKKIYSWMGARLDEMNALSAIYYCRHRTYQRCIYVNNVSVYRAALAHYLRTTYSRITDAPIVKIDIYSVYLEIPPPEDTPQKLISERKFLIYTWKDSPNTPML